MRLFAAVVPPVEAVEHLEEFLAPRREASDFRWTVPEQWHLTVAFMESVAERRIDDLVERLGRAGARRAPFELGFAAGGAFPNAARAKVLWTGVASPDLTELHRLATGVRAAAARAGAAPDGGRYRPHLTLARLGRAQEASNWVRLLASYEGPTWRAESFSLFASHLGEGPRRRPRHEEVEVFPLGRRNRSATAGR